MSLISIMKAQYSTNFFSTPLILYKEDTCEREPQINEGAATFLKDDQKIYLHTIYSHTSSVSPGFINSHPRAIMGSGNELPKAAAAAAVSIISATMLGAGGGGV